MKVFKLEIRCEGAAFDDFPAVEVARILRRQADMLSASGYFNESDNCVVMDNNGNPCGNWIYGPKLEKGDMITWGSCISSAQVIQSTAEGLTLDYGEGNIDFFRNRLPPNIVMLPPGTPLGPVDPALLKADS